MLLPGTVQDIEDTWQTDPVLMVALEMSFYQVFKFLNVNQLTTHGGSGLGIVFFFFNWLLEPCGWACL